MSAAYKPSSVENGHLSRRPVAWPLKRRLGTGRAALYVPDYLAPSGVYMTDQSPGRRCALTAPFHPYRLLGGISLLHSPWSRLHQPLAGSLPCGARTFLVPMARGHSAASSTKNYPKISLPQVSHSICCPARILCKTEEGKDILHPPHWPSTSFAIGGELCSLIAEYLAR